MNSSLLRLPAGNYKDAEADLDVLAAACRNVRRSGSGCWPCVLRSLHAREMTQQARAIADYLLKVQGGQARRVEETPRRNGASLRSMNPVRSWTRYLAQGLVDKLAEAKIIPRRHPNRE